MKEGHESQAHLRCPRFILRWARVLPGTGFLSLATCVSKAWTRLCHVWGSAGSLAQGALHRGEPASPQALNPLRRLPQETSPPGLRAGCLVQSREHLNHKTVLN